MPTWLHPFLRFFTLLAAVGLGLSILSHLAALFGFAGPLGEYSWLLHVGIFIVWLPAVLVSNRLTAGFTRKDFWRAALRGCPPWMKYMAMGFFIYAILNFVIFMAFVPPKKGSGFMPPSVVRGFSGHWMVFYAVAMALLYSATHVKDEESARTCVNGHFVGPLAEFCERCGQPVMRA